RPSRRSSPPGGRRQTASARCRAPRLPSRPSLHGPSSWWFCRAPSRSPELSPCAPQKVTQIKSIPALRYQNNPKEQRARARKAPGGSPELSPCAPQKVTQIKSIPALRYQNNPKEQRARARKAAVRANRERRYDPAMRRNFPPHVTPRYGRAFDASPPFLEL